LLVRVDFPSLPLYFLSAEPVASNQSSTAVGTLQLLLVRNLINFLTLPYLKSVTRILSSVPSLLFKSSENVNITSLLLQNG